MIPAGCTHVLPALETAFDLTPLYMKHGYHFTGPETGRVFYAWYHWHQEKWCYDPSFCDRHKRLITVSELEHAAP